MSLGNCWSNTNRIEGGVMDEDTEKFFTAVIIVLCIAMAGTLAITAWLVS